MTQQVSPESNAKNIRLLQAAIDEQSGSYRAYNALKTIGSLISGIVTGATVAEPNLWGYEWSALDIARIGMAGAAIDELVVDTPQNFMKAVRGIDMKKLEASLEKKYPEMSESEVAKLPTEVQAGYRALQGARAAGRFLSAAVVMEAALTQDYGVLNSAMGERLVASDVVALATFFAGADQLGEGFKLGRAAVTGKVE